MNEETKTPKFIFNCTECGKCCERDVIIYIDDIRDWIEHGLMYTVLPVLSIVGEYGSVAMQLDKQTQDERIVCALYDLENNSCTLEDNRPLSCRSFPLGYNGKNYIVVDMDCPGLGQGSMTAEQLARMREIAKSDYESKHRTQAVLPMLQALFIKQFSMESQKAMEKLSPEKRAELEKLLKE
ncbi:MAG: YkgJ family cysteine cluster protein [Methanosarcinales archaeon]|nr:YkgJ family cysteine cluster protein [ANME-2 cluster archaeon]MDF1531025.1 YkgJ family cysteine cluster protein [ANME-2 cluster archaeon]MDW7775481.1 YkgJ family cysteine cluster protein [Methanosarcinales archaeon]